MNTHELVAALREAGVNERLYAIYTQPRPAGRFAYEGSMGAGSLYLRRDPDGRWVHGVFERGVWTPERYFDSEDEACRFTLDRLLRH